MGEGEGGGVVVVTTKVKFDYPKGLLRPRLDRSGQLTVQNSPNDPKRLNKTQNGLQGLTNSQK
jgi:hypothetical protein